MPAKMIGSMTYHTHLTKGEEQVFWHEQRKSLGVAITARDRLAAQQGKKVTVQERLPATPRRQSS